MKPLTHIFLLLVLPVSVWGQLFEKSGDNLVNQCAVYYNHPKDSNKAKFHMLTITKYLSNDSNKPKQRLDEVETLTYNSMGQMLSRIVHDSDGFLTDSSVHMYDGKFRKVDRVEYYRSGYSHQMDVEDDEYWTYDSKGNVVKDSSDNYWSDYRDRAYEVRYYKYDDAGNVSQYVNIRNHGDYGEYDSAITFYKYDKQRREIFSETRHNGEIRNRNYNTYNEFGKKIFEARLYKNSKFLNEVLGNEVSREDARGKDGEFDSTAEVIMFNGQGKFTGRKSYRNGALTHSVDRTFNKDGGRTDIGEQMSTADPMACPNNKVDVCVYDSSDRIISDVETAVKNSLPFVTTEVHKYTLEHNKVIIDSTTIIEQGHLHSSTSQKITTYKYDSKGHKIEMREESGEEYHTDNGEDWKYNAQDSLTYRARYNLCTMSKPSAESVYTYYPDGKKLKRSVEITSYSRTIIDYGEDSRAIQEFYNHRDNYYNTNTVKLYIYEYK